VLRELAAKFLTLAEKQGAAIPLMIGHRLMGTSLMCVKSHPSPTPFRAQE
jgi:hypothetical protein